MPYAPALRTARQQLVLDALDAAVGPGRLVIGTAAMAQTLVTIPLADPAGAVSGDVLTLTTPREADAVLTGTAAEARLEDGAGTVVRSGLTVGLPGSGAGGADPDVTVPATQIVAGVTVVVLSATLTHAS